jgi:cell division protein FtsB
VAVKKVGADERGSHAMDLRVGPLSRVRIIPSPEERLRTLVERAPQAEAWADRMAAKLRPTLTMLHGIWRRLATVGVAALAVWLFVHVMFGANGMVVYRQKKAEYVGLQTEIRNLQQENDRYTDQIKSLQTDPKTIEKEAREQLHYARPGEVVYVSPPPPPPPTPAISSARK